MAKSSSLIVELASGYFGCREAGATYQELDRLLAATMCQGDRQILAFQGGENLASEIAKLHTVPDNAEHGASCIANHLLDGVAYF